MLNLLSKVAVQQDSDKSKIVRLSNITEGVDGAGVFGYSMEAQNAMVEDHQTRQFKHTTTLDLRVVRPDGTDLDDLQNMVQEKCRFSGYTPNGFLIWHSPSILKRNTQYSDMISDAVIATVGSPPGYVGDAPNAKMPTYAGRNALALWNVLKGDNNVLNGFELDGGASGSVSGKEQTITVGSTTDPGTVLWKSRKVLFPFDGKRLTGSLTLHQSDFDLRIAVRFYNPSGSFLSAIEDTVSATTTEQRISVTGSTPSNTAEIQLAVKIDSANDGEEADVSEPMIGVEDEQEFTL